MKKSKSPVEKILENLIKLTTVPREKSVLCWKRESIFGSDSYEVNYKSKTYRFDGRHFYVYPAGGPDVLLHVRIDAIPKHFGELWQRVCGQHEKEIAEDQAAQEQKNKAYEVRQGVERKRILENTKRILEDFK